MVFEVALVCYRDFGNSCHFETLDFTTNISNVETLLDKVKATGGGDTPEDVQGAFMHALVGISKDIPALSWGSSDDYASRSLIWMSDAPPHGSMMASFADDYPHVSVNEWRTLFECMRQEKMTLTIVKLKEANDTANAVLQKWGQAEHVNVQIRDISQNMADLTSEDPFKTSRGATATFVYLASEVFDLQVLFFYAIISF